MLFEERELKPYTEPITRDDLKVGEVYFSVNFVDDDMTIPDMEPLVFAGFNLASGDSGRVYFQDVDSYRRGVRYPAADYEYAVFSEGAKDDIKHIFEYDRALDVLLVCSLRRRSRGQRQDLGGDEVRG